MADKQSEYLKALERRIARKRIQRSTREESDRDALLRGAEPPSYGRLLGNPPFPKPKPKGKKPPPKPKPKPRADSATTFTMNG